MSSKIFKDALHKTLASNTDISKYCMHIMIHLHDENLHGTRNRFAHWVMTKGTWLEHTPDEIRSFIHISDTINPKSKSGELMCVLFGIMFKKIKLVYKRELKKNQ